MNKKRRIKLKEAIQGLERADDIIRQVCDEESDTLDNIPENLLESDRFFKMEDGLNYLEDASSSIEDAIGLVREACE